MHYLPPTYVVRGKVLFRQACDILFKEGGQARPSMLWSRFGGIKLGGLVVHGPGELDQGVMWSMGCGLGSGRLEVHDVGGGVR